MTEGFFGERGNEGGGKRDADKRKRKKKTFPACPAPSSSLSGGNEGLWKCIKCKERRETDRQGGGGGGEDGGGREEEEEGEMLLVERFHIKRDRNIPLAV